MNSAGVRTGAPTGAVTRPVTQAPPVRNSLRVATSGLVLVMSILTFFSVTVSVTNSRGTQHAQLAAAESDLIEQAVEALLAQEESAEEVVACLLYTSPSPRDRS